MSLLLRGFSLFLTAILSFVKTKEMTKKEDIDDDDEEEELE